MGRLACPDNRMSVGACFQAPSARPGGHDARAVGLFNQTRHRPPVLEEHLTLLFRGSPKAVSGTVPSLTDNAYHIPACSLGRSFP